MGEKRIDWDKIRAEYIAGNTSYRKLAKKHKVPISNLNRVARNERWTELRETARNKAVAKQIQKTAASAADNAATAQRIKAKLLARLEREIDSLPVGQIGTATVNQIENIKVDGTGRPVKERKSMEVRLRELTAAYKDLTADIMPEQGASSELLQSLMDLERRAQDD